MPSPIVAATLQAAGLSTLSNILAQIINAYQKSAPFSLDLIELLRFVTLSFISAPPNYKWQQFLEATFPAYPRSSGGNQHRSKDDIEMKAGGANDIVGIGSGDAVELGNRQGSGQGGSFSLRNTLTKWFIDCITVGAIMNTVAFLIIMGLMKGKTLGEIGTSVRTVCLDPFSII
jgi:hypothetical protein